MYNEIIQIIINNKTTLILIGTNRFALIINVLILINTVISVPRSSLVRSVKIKDYPLRVNILSTIHISVQC